MILKKIFWVFKRHPFLYIARFKLLSKNSNVDDINGYNYNLINDKKDIPIFFNEINQKIFKNYKPTSDFELIKHLSTWLLTEIKGGPGLSEPSDTALQIMLSGKGGVCSDMAQIFNNFCVINDIKVREWGTTRAPFNRAYGGHSFNEVYSNELNKWVLIDVYNSLLFYSNSDTPLSVVELYRLLRDKEFVQYKSFYEKNFVEESSVAKNFLDPDTVPFLICNYSNKTYDAFLRYTRPHIPVFVSHFMLYILGKSYHYRFPLDDYKKIFS